MAGFETKDEVAKAMLLIVHLLTSKILRLSNCKNLGFVTCVYRTVWCVHSSCCTRTKQAMDLLMILSLFSSSKRWGVLPTLTLPDGTVAGQSRALLRYLGKVVKVHLPNAAALCLRACVRACVRVSRRLPLDNSEYYMTVRPIRWTARHCIQTSLQWLYW